MPNYKDLWYSGELVTAAVTAQSAAHLAAKLGVSPDALSRALRRLHEADKKVPKLHELFSKRPAAVASRLPGVPEVGVGMYEPAVEELSDLEEHRLKKELKEVKAHNKELMDKLLNTQDELGVVKEAAQYKIAPIKPREHKSGLHEGCSLVLVSDNHLGEGVTSQSTNGLNEHTPEIARSRMTRLFEGAGYLTKLARNVNLVRDMVVWLGGDHISGRIHEDLSESNLLSTPEEMAFAQQVLADGLRYFLKDDKIEHISVVCSPGNHSRITHQMRVHTRIETNLETLLFISLAREFAGDKRISFNLPTSALTYFKIYDRTVRAFHGDLIKYGGALAGVQGPLTRAILKWDQAMPAQLNILGHYHSYKDHGNAIINGSTVGTNAYSLSIACPHERPQQAWALIDKKRFRSLSAPVFCTED